MNKPLDFGMLNTQTDPRFGERPYGKFGTIAKNGCGMIALYNVQRAADGKTQFDPFYEARKPIKTNFFGLLGTRPSAVAKTLRKKGFTVKMIRPKKAGKAEPHDAVIVLYWRFWGAHYVAGIGDGNGAYTLYNEFSQPRAMRLDEFMTNLKEQKLHPFKIWGIGFPKGEAAKTE